RAGAHGAPPPRALRRARLSRWPGRHRDPAGRAHHWRGRQLRRDGHAPPVPPGPHARGDHGGDAGGARREERSRGLRPLRGDGVDAPGRHRRLNAPRAQRGSRDRAGARTSVGRPASVRATRLPGAIPRQESAPMFTHNKRLQYTVRVSEPNPALANLLLEQFGGPQGELAAAMRYFTQALAEEDAGRKDMLLDIATEELSHLEVIGSLVGMLNKGAKGRLAEGVEEEGELFRSLQGAGNDSHLTQVLYGGGPALINSGGQLWNAGYIDSIGEPTADL